MVEQLKLKCPQIASNAGVIVSILVLIFTQSSFALDRTNDYQRLEPRGNFVLHGAGQETLATFQAYENALPVNNRPELYMAYLNLRSDSIPKWGDDLINNLNKAGPWVIPQIAISMYNYMVPGGRDHYEDKVAQGVYDANILQLLAVLNKMNRPVFLRIGHEFNGFWTGYDPQNYVLAFQHIVKYLRGTFHLEVATVWDVSVDAVDLDYMKFYPGDEYVDWWGINLFSREAMSLSVTEKFLQDAGDTTNGRHPHPVMIGESTPRNTGAQNGQQSWDAWYADYFQFIKTHDRIKAFCYIDVDWSADPVFSTWGDSRIETNPVVLKNYREEMQNPLYLHQTGERTLRNILGLAPPIENN